MDCSVSGGENNTAETGVAASVSGGSFNVASGRSSTVSGGGGNSPTIGLTVSADFGWVAGNTTTPGTGTAKFIAP
jgi:hypothetical protein